MADYLVLDFDTNYYTRLEEAEPHAIYLGIKQIGASQMKNRKNAHGQPIGFEVPEWNGATPPNRDEIRGEYCTLVPVDPINHLEDLFEAYAVDKDGLMWTYLPVGPFDSADDLRNWLKDISVSEDPMFFTIIDNNTGGAVGVASYLRLDPAMGVIEVGFITFSPLLQRTCMSTETMYLMMKRAFDDWGYRRYEWKCDSLNQPSCNAASRLGFTFEGIFRQATMYKGRNRDTAWFSILDSEWPAIKSGFQNWLSPNNFDMDGIQQKRLQDLIRREQSKVKDR